MTHYEEEKALAESEEIVAKKSTGFFKKAFQDMKESAKAQHEVDKVQFRAAKAEARADFEENKFHNSFARAKAQAKQHWDDAHMTPAQRTVRDQQVRNEKIAEGNARIAAAEERLEAAKK